MSKNKVKPKYNIFQNTWYMILLAWTKKEKKVIFTAMLLIIFGILLNIINLFLTPVILSVVENKVAISTLLAVISIFFSLILIINGLNSYVSENVLYGRVQVRIELIGLLNNKACKTSYSNIENEEFYKLSQQAALKCSNNREATEAIWATLVTIFINLICFILYALLFSQLTIILLLIIISTTIISFLINNHLSEYKYKNKDKEANESKKINYVNNIASSMSFAKDIRIFGLKSWVCEIRDKSMDLLEDFSKKVNRVYFWARFSDLILTLLRNLLVYVYLIYLVVNNNLSIPQFVLYFSAVDAFTSVLNGVLTQFNVLKKQSLDITIVREALEYKEAFKFEDGLSLDVNQDENYLIELKNVSFRYQGKDKNTLTNINLKIRPNEKIAIVGLNGAGKTTLVKLICGFYDPTEGEVLLNGVNIKEYNREHYYKLFSAVFQNFSLLASSIAANVAQSEDNINYDLVYSSIEKAGLKDKVESLPNKYDSLLNREVYEDATNLSGGETQRLMLARALYKNAPIIILDEPTSALDPLAEADIYNKYNEFTNNKSSIFISHRLASTRFCDRILFIADEKIVEEGTHEELLKFGGKYSELFEIQSKYYREGGSIDE